MFLYDRAQSQALYARLIAGHGWPQSPWLDVLLFGFGVSYVVAALLRARRYRTRLRDREPALTIGQLARRSGYPEYLVSAVINRRFDGHFWDYINRQRIEAASAHLADASDARSILEIAYACGFTSKSTFNAAFKRQLGQTPSAYRQGRVPGAQRPQARSAATAAASRTPPD
ncbi:helix-turn-helix domain-containing protein [Luteimonas aquatica]|uniref:helix-turn-helix domain-containing protein n=1 Tax=Luteimonas aquatica TaxID=450364 RepID=UPI001F565C0E|nr:helix-turn-helix transcriptional regulator [Luteimonas aquatica]